MPELRVEDRSDGILRLHFAALIRSGAIAILLLQHLQQRLGDFAGEFGIVDVVIDFDHGNAGLEILLDRIKARPIGFRIPEVGRRDYRAWRRPCSGSTIATGAVAALAAAAIISPILTFSSTLVRSKVTFGFH